MPMKNTIETYGTVHKAIHWVMALVMIGLIIAGIIMTRMEPAPLKFDIYGLHKAIGIIILGLFALRILWKLSNPKPQSLSTHAVWERTLAKLAHIGLYILMIAMPLTGWAMSSAGGYPVDFFGIVTLPHLMEKNETLGGLLNQAHRIMSYALIGVITLHISGAIKHHVIDKDSTLRRMLP